MRAIASSCCAAAVTAMAQTEAPTMKHGVPEVGRDVNTVEITAQPRVYHFRARVTTVSLACDWFLMLSRTPWPCERNIFRIP